MTGARFGVILAAHLARYPLMQARDIYKLAHQAALGSEHAVSDMAQARAWLDEEIRTLGDGPYDPLIDPISPGGEIVRLHLRPFVRMHGDLTMLLTAFVRTANDYHGDVARLEAYLASAQEMADAGALPIAANQLRVFIEERRTEGSPAAHHSPEYGAAYGPAYRVVLRSQLKL